MLNYPDVELFFDNCLNEAGIKSDQAAPLSLVAISADLTLFQTLLATLHDLVNGADAVLARGKPAEDTLRLSDQEWEWRWTAWVASRKAAFFGRAALLLLGDTEQQTYFVKTLRTSHNIVFISAANDVLQHATGRYLNGPEEDLPHTQLAVWWESQLHFVAI